MVEKMKEEKRYRLNDEIFMERFKVVHLEYHKRISDILDILEEKIDTVKKEEE